MGATREVAERLVALAGAVAGVNGARLGIPESQSVRLEADVTLGSRSEIRQTRTTYQYDQRYLVTFAYRVEKDESVAEAALMDALDEFTAVLHEDMTLGGLGEVIAIDTGLAESPEYQPRAGKEFREYPVLVIVRVYGG